MGNALQLINPETLTATVQSLPEQVAWIQRNHDRGIEAGEKLLNSVLGHGGQIATKEEYDAIGEYLNNAKNCKAKMYEKRSPVTQLMDSYRKVFTALEGDFDVNNTATVPGKLKALRDQYAAMAARKAQEAARKAQEEAMAVQAVESYKQGVRGVIQQRLNYLCGECANLIKKQFDAINLRNYYAIKTYIENFKEEITRGMLLDRLLDECHVPAPQHIATDHEQLKQIRLEVYYSCESEMMIAFSVYCKKTKQNYLDLMTAKKEQLELAEKDAAAAKAREEEIKRKQAEDEAKAVKEREEQAAKEAEKAKMEAEQRIAMGLFGSMEQAGTDSGVKTKTKKVLHITSKQAFLSLLNYWWLNEGQSLDVEELSKTFKKMITYAEKRANGKNPEMVTGEGIEFLDEVTAK